MASIEAILARLKALQDNIAGELLRSPRVDKDAAYEFGRIAGVVEGIDRAVEEVELALRPADE